MVPERMKPRLKGLLGLGGLVGIVALQGTPIPYRWFGFQEVKYHDNLYAIKRSEERTVLINNPGDGLFVEYRIDDNNDGKVDSHYFKSTIPSRLQGYVTVSKPITEADQDILKQVTSLSTF